MNKVKSFLPEPMNAPMFVASIPDLVAVLQAELY